MGYRVCHVGNAFAARFLNNHIHKNLMVRKRCEQGGRNTRLVRYAQNSYTYLVFVKSHPGNHN